jgi:hypothetical protein
MSELQNKLIKEAREIYHQIFPCSSKRRLEDCFTIMDNKYLFWFNTADRSTHVVTGELKDKV